MAGYAENLVFLAFKMSIFSNFDVNIFHLSENRAGKAGAVNDLLGDGSAGGIQYRGRIEERSEPVRMICKIRACHHNAALTEIVLLHIGPRGSILAETDVVPEALCVQGIELVTGIAALSGNIIQLRKDHNIKIS